MLEEKIYKDYIKALKTHNKHKADFLSFIRAEIKNKAISLKKDKLDDSEIISVLNKQKKRLKETKESILFKREELIEEVEKELAILEEYLPQPMSEEEICNIVDEVISELGVCSIKEMGKVMKEAMSRVAFRASGERVSKIVKKRLSS